MSEGLRAVQMGIAGIAIGSATAWAGDYIFAQALQMSGMNKGDSMLNNLGQTGRAAFQVVVAGSFGALMMYSGDKVLEMVTNGQDPLYHVLYYQVAFSTSATIMSAARGVKVVLDQLTAASQSTQQAPPPKTTMENVQAQRNAAVAASYQSHRMGGRTGCLAGTGCGK